MPDAEIQEILVEIEEKKKKADELATEFRRLYRESQEAYADGDGELAKELSEEGHNLQDTCEVINQEVRVLYEKLRVLNEQKRKSRVTHSLPLTALKGMPDEFQKTVIDALKSLPHRHVSGKLIERVSYSDRYVENPVTKETQQANTDFPVVGGKPVIRINKQTHDGRWTRINSIKFAVAHEVGHIVYHYFVTDEQRVDWEFRFVHQDNNPEESFSNSYAWYYLKRDEMVKEYPATKIFFDGLKL